MATRAVCNGPRNSPDRALRLRGRRGVAATPTVGPGTDRGDPSPHVLQAIAPISVSRLPIGRLVNILT